MKQHVRISKVETMFYFISILTGTVVLNTQTGTEWLSGTESNIHSVSGVGMVLLLGGHDVIDRLALLQLLLHLHQQLDSIHHHLHQLHLREAQSVGVGDVEHSAHSGRVDST